ncbi:MAG: hypothetical protein AAFX50_26210, partial [Acidobacteriota bacterium]
MSHDPPKPAGADASAEADAQAPDQTRRLTPDGGSAEPIASEQPTILTRPGGAAGPGPRADSGSHDHGETTLLPSAESETATPQPPRPPSPGAPVTAAPPIT